MVLKKDCKYRKILPVSAVLDCDFCTVSYCSHKKVDG